MIQNAEVIEPRYKIGAKMIDYKDKPNYKIKKKRSYIIEFLSYIIIPLAVFFGIYLSAEWVYFEHILY